MAPVLPNGEPQIWLTPPPFTPALCHSAAEHPRSAFPSRLNANDLPLWKREEVARGADPSRQKQFTITFQPSRPDPYDPFIIPDSILLHSPVSPQTQSKLLQLPPELLTDIFRKVNIPYFQICLALTCKTMARVAAQKNALSPWRGYRDKDGLFRLLERKNNFIPPHLKLCRACFRFMPTTRGNYWEQQMSALIFDGLSMNWYDLLEWFNGHNRFGTRCPWCVAYGYSSHSSEGKYNHQRAEEVLSVGERMHPELNRRMDKP
ncbi:hypothetical protein AYL99_04466 [Fonsecaea erecta]|uniref:F-box domain-containing protein n=1 Tax=Fonsecaea erecta TaxID=1367422 RepID=A0A178ZST8_9EURO|nr:hypothetical protein AYL99_04466 [Fonsecaea erecta]OAP62263.1 hypothetical protein AYL99_04466 [Fonsecaea erecta]